MKLEVGMYVRTQKYGIAKIIGGVNDNKFNIDIFKKDGITLRCQKAKDIINASHNIIDLIEVGDYVNGYEVYEILPTDAVLVKNKDYPLICRSEIKSIVTKEQFESMSYKVGD